MFEENNFNSENFENKEEAQNEAPQVIYGEQEYTVPQEEKGKKSIAAFFGDIKEKTVALFYKVKDYVVNNKKRSAVIAGCLAVVIACTVVLAVRFWPKKNTPTVPKKTVKQTTSSEPAVVTVENPIDFATLQAQNPEICAWISIPGTNVNYPILQSGKDRDEDYYLTHTSEYKSATKGAIYIQKINSNTFTDRNTVVYGHNMLNGSMFGTLKYYRKTAGFFDQNSVMYIYTPDKVLTYNIYSAFMYDDRHLMYSFNMFADDKNFQSFIDETLNPKSMTKHVREGVEVTTNSKLVTLSTCAGADNERYLVVGVLTDEQNAVYGK